jgi:hypothetical protein
LTAASAIFRLLALLDDVLTRPIVSAEMIVQNLGITGSRPFSTQPRRQAGVTQGDRTGAVSGVEDPEAQSVLSSAAKQMPVAMFGHPAGTSEVCFPGAPGALGLAVWIEMQHEPRDLGPIGAVIFGVDQAQIGDQVLFVIAR